MLHSSGSSPRQWDALVSRLSARFGQRIAAPRLVGHDGHRGWGFGEIPSLEGEVAHLRSQVGPVAGPIHLVGHSYGGAVAVRAALSGLFEVRSLSLYEPSMFALLGERLDRYPAGESPAAVARSVARSLANRQDAEGARAYIDYWCGENTFEGWPAERQARIVARMPSVEACFDALFWDSTAVAELQRLDMPCLVMCGARSPRSSRDICELFAGSLPRARLHQFPGLNHMGPVTEASTVNAVIDEFLFQVSRERRAA